MTGFRSSRVVVEGEMRPATVRVEGGLIVEVGEGPADDDFGDLVVIPGLVDSHVHVNDPGRADWEGFETATRAALAGGTTTIVDMPLNSIPPTLTVEALEAKLDAARDAIGCDVAFWGGFVGPQQHLGPLVEAGVCGFKSFLVDSGVEEFPSVTPAQLGPAMETMASLGVPALIHAEDPKRLGVMPARADSYRVYMESRPVDSESEAVRDVAVLATVSGADTHVLHLSSGDAAAEIGAGPENLTAETCPHYLTFCAEEISDGETVFKCSPPIRDAEHREALWEALDKGWLAMVVSDHSPAPASLKGGDFSTAWGGISSLQLRLPATWTGASARGHPIPRLVEWLATAPARLAGLADRKGVIAPGWDADLVIWDPDGVTEVEGSSLHHRHPLTPYQGMTLRGRVVATVLRGDLAARGGEVLRRRGRILRR